MCNYVHDVILLIKISLSRKPLLILHSLDFSSFRMQMNVVRPVQ